MLLRDRYIEDTAMQFFPDFSMNNYLSHLMKLKASLQIHYVRRNTEKIWNNKLSSVVPASLFIASLIPIIFHKKIPKLRNFTSVKARISFALLLYWFSLFELGVSFLSQVKMKWWNISSIFRSSKDIGWLGTPPSWIKIFDFMNNLLIHYWVYLY